MDLMNGCQLTRQTILYTVVSALETCSSMAFGSVWNKIQTHDLEVVVSESKSITGIRSMRRQTTGFHLIEYLLKRLRAWDAN